MMTWADLEGLAAAIFIVFLPCRPIALIRMDVLRARTRRSDGAIIVPAQEKTDSAKGRTEIVFRTASNPRLSTRFYYDILLRRAQSLGVFDALFCSDAGQTYKRSDSIGNALKRVLQKMAVEGFTGYSFRHAMIQALFDAGLNEMQVNAYTGHSNSSHTAVNWYYHLDKAWAGDKIRGTDRVPLSQEAQRVILADGTEE
jgi:integrase